MVQLKIRKIGNSNGLVLPKEVLAQMKVKAGDSIYLTEAEDGGFRITPTDPEFAKQIKAASDVMKRYRNTLKELAK